ncbi:MAG: transporter substrate-binding domain-containing protein [Halofilum sp. (in: g-proteobacteria)]|nr:transporter substrate-binding domain-containing protein [Halofilum sp. (in: g-proteobacteria)]
MMAVPGSALAKAVSYTVRSGDSLSRIALRVYGDAAAWPTIHDANRDRLDNPDLIRVGQRLLIPDAESDDPALERERRGSVRLVSGDAYPPYAGRDLYRAGLTTEIVRRAFDRAGYEVEIARRGWADGYDATLAGDYDGTFPYLPNERRQREFAGRVSPPLTTVLVRLFTRAEQRFEYRSDDDLRGMVACRPRGHFTHDLDPLVEAGHIDLLRTGSTAACFDRLASGRVDFVPVNRFTAAAAVRRAGLDPARFHMARRPFHRDTLNLLISPRADSGRELLADFSEALAGMRERGEIRTMRSEHIARYRGVERAGPWNASYGDGATTAVRNTASTDDGGAASNEPGAGDPSDRDGDSAVARAGAGDAPTGGEREPSGDASGAAASADAESTLRFVSGPAYAPFAGPDLPGGGMTAEIVDRAAAITGHEVELEFRAWKAGYRAAAEKRFDGTFPYVKTDYRRGDFAFTRPLYSMAVMIFTRAGSDLEYRGLNDLRGTAVCKAAGYYRMDVEDLIAAGFARLVEEDSLAGCFRRLGRGDVDFVTVNRYTGAATIRGLSDYARDDFRMLEQPIAQVDLHLMIPDAASDTYSLVVAFDNALEKLQDSGELQAIQERHLEAYRARTP